MTIIILLIGWNDEFYLICVIVPIIVANCEFFFTIG